MKIQNIIDPISTKNEVTSTASLASQDLLGNVTEKLPSEIYPTFSSSTVDISSEGKRRLSEIQGTRTLADGEQIMAQRLYSVSDSALIPAPVTKADGTSIYLSSMRFLTHDDQNILSKAYQYAANNNIDPTKVDYLASDMANYRFISLTGGDFETEDGEIWNTDGSPLYIKMSADDATLATKMLQSTEINSSAMDKDFLARELNPRGGGWINETNRGHAVDYEFLQKIIQVTGSGTNDSDVSKEAAETAMDPRFAHALSMIRNQDKPLMPPADYVPPEKKANDAGKDRSASFADNLQKILNGNDSDEELSQKLANLLGVKFDFKSSSSTLVLLLERLHTRSKSYDLKNMIARILDENK